MRSLLIYIILLVPGELLFSQGFDWQFSARLPFDSPIFFIGISGGYGYEYHYGNIGFSEHEIQCANFDKSHGSEVNIGICSEYWLGGTEALAFKISYRHDGGKFSKDTVLPRINGDFRSEYIFESGINYISGEIGFKKRLGWTHLHFGAAFEVSYLLGNSNKYYERVISPPEWPWHERTIAAGRIPGINSFLLSPKLKIGYDFNLGPGMYCNTSLSTAFTMMSIVENSNWRIWGLCFNLSVFRGILPY